MWKYCFFLIILLSQPEVRAENFSLASSGLTFGAAPLPLMNDNKKQEICELMRGYVEDKFKGTPQTHPRKSLLSSTLVPWRDIEVAVASNPDPEVGYEDCLRALNLREGSVAASSIFSTLPLEGLSSKLRPVSAIKPSAMENQLNKCKQFDYSIDCWNKSPLPDDFFKFSTSLLNEIKPQASLVHKPGVRNFLPIKKEFVVEGFSPTPEKANEQCTCLRKQMEGELTVLSTKGLDNKLKAEKAKLNTIILDEYGKKFLNNYASNLENMSFFLGQTAGMFGDNVHEAKNYQCNNHKKFEEAIEDKCGNQDKEKLEERMNTFLSVFEKDRSQKKFKRRLQSLNQEILQVSHNGKILTRAEYDSVRHGLSRDPQVQIAEKLVAKLIKNDSYKKQIFELMKKEETSTPMTAITELLAKEGQKDLAAFKKAFFSKEILGEEGLDEFKNFSFAESAEFFSKKIGFAMGTHPGFAIALENKDVFARLGDVLKKRNHDDVISALEQEPEILPEFLSSQCNDLLEGFANAVCTSKDSLLGKVDRRNLEKIMTDFQKKAFVSDSRLHALLLCDEAMHRSGNKEFHDIGSEDRQVINSDFLDRMGKPFDQQINAFSNTLKSELQDEKRSSLKEYLQWASRDSEKWKQAAGGGGVLSQELFLAAEKSGKTVKFKNDEKLITEVSTKETQTLAPQSSSLNEITEAIQAPVRAPASVSNLGSSSFRGETVVPPNYSQIKQEMSQFLSKDRNENEVQKHLANIDDKSLIELQKIKEESLRDQERLLEISSKNEELKLKALQDKVQALLKKRDEVQEVSSPNETQKNQSEPIAENYKKTTVSNAAASGSTISNESSSDAPSLNAPRTTAVSQFSGKESTFKQKVEAVQSSSTGSVGAIIIESSKTKKNDNDLVPKDLSQDIISYLNEAKPDLVTLKQMKEKGMLYKFKTLKDGVFVEKEVLIPFGSLTEEARKLIESKIAEKKDPAIEELNRQIATVTREHSFQALKIIIGEQLQKR
jgi:hypothetical protein